LAERRKIEDEAILKFMKPFYLKWKKLAAEKEALEKEYEERAAQI